jgi:mono/diheme cytochrome c family protein
MKRFLATVAVLALAAAIAAAVVVYGGLYDISATDQHLRPTYKVLDVAMRRAVQLRAKAIDVPPLGDPALAARGLALFREHCVQCHGAPGIAPEPFALGLTPSAANLVHTAREWKPGELFWVVKNGLKMTGMPAWEFRMSEADLWSVVAFLAELPSLSPQAYARRAAAIPRAGPVESAPAAAPDADRGRTAILQYACITCHVIPGVVGANAPVGPPLAGMAARSLIAGVLPNTSENLVRFLRYPKDVKPLGAMPNLGVTERDAVDMAAYLRTLREAN